MPRARSRLIASPSPVPSCRRVRPALHLHERVEDRLQLVRRDADARVAHADVHPVAAHVAPGLDAPRAAVARLGELHRVRQQVEQDLLQLVGVRADGQRGSQPAHA
jgi:hypothetical protein